MPARVRRPRAPEKKPKAPRPTTRDRKPVGKSGEVSAKDFMRALTGDMEDADFAFFSDPGTDSTVTEWISTGSLAVDRLLGGGWPIGRITEVAAWEGVGKSTLLDQSIAQHQRGGGIAALVDTEQARDQGYSAALGVRLGDLIMPSLGNDVSIEGAFGAIDRVLDTQAKILAAAGKRKPPSLLIVWDSVAGCPTRAELEGGADAKHMMQAARVIKMNLRRITARLPKLRAALVFANHFYESPPVMGRASSLKTYGGSGIRYFASVRLWLTRIGKLTSGDVELGHIVEAKLRKTRVRKPRPPALVGLVYGAGFDNSHTVYEWGKTHGTGGDHVWVKQKGPWGYLMLPDGTYEAFQGGFRGFGDALLKHPDAYTQMAAQYLAEGA